MPDDAVSNLPFNSIDTQRMPLEDPAAEAARTEAYWANLNRMAGTGIVTDAAMPIMDMKDGRCWVRLLSASDADYEAFHMRHSIGHSWAKYSGIGEILSLRPLHNIPQATILVSNGVVIHAREQENARLSPENQQAMEQLCEDQGWTIKPDAFPFDLLIGAKDAGPNTCLKYLARDPSNAKVFNTVVLAGRLTEEQIREMASALQDGLYFDPVAVGLDPLDHTSGAAADRHEVLSIRYVEDEGDCVLDAQDFHAAWLSAAEAGWSSDAGPELH